MTTGTRWLDSEQQVAWRAYLLGTARLMAKLDDDLRQFGLGINDYEILVRLSEAPERRLRMAELADRLHQSRSRLTHTVGRLEASELVRRTSCKSDKRGVWAELTDAGFSLLEQAAPYHVDGVRENLVNLASPEDFAAIGRVFDAVSEHIGQR
ncbi:MarR family winged helix-turn-helix transcriptional regulator [Kribbella sp. VKM Ac-2568]|uniref:MarR family winged helix-turn-helix transcriptional regulator n=1 Tax=Kribbella sp. VKM Ac-2568 TaxID=2512219 RepID=UPI00104E895D|nr:MarR family transcriptional regulator [Kribbella sp. VKM Ac-2568]TCM43750.1 DNA-binding MarR family transcriptional regulator [Kribbella sp. VKM Ac-2568]